MSIDWSDISKLRFRDYGGKILEVFAPKNERVLSERYYPVKVFVEESDGRVNECSYTIDGIYSRDITSSKDILQICEEPFSFLEIVELISKKAVFYDTSIPIEIRIVYINFPKMEFTFIDPNGQRYLNSLSYLRESVHYSFDGLNYSKLYKETK